MSILQNLQLVGRIIGVILLTYLNIIYPQTTIASVWIIYLYVNYKIKVIYSETQTNIFMLEKHEKSIKDVSAFQSIILKSLKDLKTFTLEKIKKQKNGINPTD